MYSIVFKVLILISQQYLMNVSAGLLRVKVSDGACEKWERLQPSKISFYNAIFKFTSIIFFFSCIV